MILLDTHVFLWWMADDRRLGKRSRQLILSPDNAVQVSAASLWEIAIKHALGRLKFPKEPARLLPKIIADYGFRELAITGKHALAAGSLPPIHPDPFDRMLIAQANLEGLILLTADSIVRQYPVRHLDAGE